MKMYIDKIKAKEVFADYVKNYDESDELIKLKIDHTYRVSENCEKIASSLGFTQKEVDIAYLLGLLHDLGRFEQAKKYRTFNDAKSIDHAALSCDILFKDNMIRKFVSEASEDKLIEDAIRYHSCYKVPKELSMRTAAFTHILRDADKIDIFKVNIIEPLDKVYDVPKDEIYKSTITEEVIENVKNRETVLRKLKKTAADNVAGHISLVFGLVYDQSIKLAMENGDLKKLMEFKFENPTTNKQLAEITDIVNSYVEEKQAHL